MFFASSNNEGSFSNPYFQTISDMKTFVGAVFTSVLRAEDNLEAEKSKMPLIETNVMEVYQNANML